MKSADSFWLPDKRSFQVQYSHQRPHWISLTAGWAMVSPGGLSENTRPRQIQIQKWRRRNWRVCCPQEDCRKIQTETETNTDTQSCRLEDCWEIQNRDIYKHCQSHKVTKTQGIEYVYSFNTVSAKQKLWNLVFVRPLGVSIMGHVRVELRYFT